LPPRNRHFDKSTGAAGLVSGGSSASPSEPDRMNHDMAKGFMPERERTERILAPVKSVSDETGRSMAQVALN
jgi:aryl-alcohol dehydrogenase-like predicted oxidoreductase